MQAIVQTPSGPLHHSYNAHLFFVLFQPLLLLLLLLFYPFFYYVLFRIFLLFLLFVFLLLLLNLKQEVGNLHPLDQRVYGSGPCPDVPVRAAGTRACAAKLSSQSKCIPLRDSTEILFGSTSGMGPRAPRDCRRKQLAEKIPILPTWRPELYKCCLLGATWSSPTIRVFIRSCIPSFHTNYKQPYNNPRNIPAQVPPQLPFCFEFSFPLRFSSHPTPTTYTTPQGP